MNRSNTRVVDPTVKELSDKDLQNLYSLAAIKKLQPGEPVFSETTEEPFVYLFVDGELDVLKEHAGVGRKILRLAQEKGSAGIAFIADQPWPVTVKAARPSTVLVLRTTVFASLDEKIQLYFYKRRYRFDRDLISQLLALRSDMDRHKDQVQTYLLSLHSCDREAYEKSELITAILEKIPRLPAFTGTLAVRLMDDRISAKDVADLVKEDPSLAAVVLKTVNSPYYGFGKNISDINHAVILLGINELYQLVIAEGVKRSMPNSPNFRDLFMHSICISRIGFALSAGSHVGKPAEVSTIGLLHDLGKSVKHLLKKQNPKLSMLIDSIDAAAIGAVMMERWNLPERVWKSIELQEYTRFASPDHIPASLCNNVGALHLAHICYDLFRGREGAARITPFTGDYVRLFGVENGSVQHLAQKIILPVLMKNLQSFPAVFRKLVTQHKKHCIGISDHTI